MTRCAIRSAAALLLLLSSFVGSAKDFVVGVEQTDYYPIYAYRDDQYVGFAREVLDAFAAKQGHSFSYVALPVRRLFADFLGGDTLDFKFPDNPVWQPDLKKGIEVAYSGPVFESIEGAMVLPERAGGTLADLKRLGTIRGFTPWPFQDAITAKTIALEESDDLKSLVQKALLKRIDAVFINQAIADYHLSQDLKRPGALVLDRGLPNNDVAYLMSTRRHPDVIEQLTAFLASEQALIAELRKKYKLD